MLPRLWMHQIHHELYRRTHCGFTANLWPLILKLMDKRVTIQVTMWVILLDLCASWQSSLIMTNHMNAVIRCAKPAFGGCSLLTQQVLREMKHVSWTKLQSSDLTMIHIMTSSQWWRLNIPKLLESSITYKNWSCTLGFIKRNIERRSCRVTEAQSHVIPASYYLHLWKVHPLHKLLF